MENNFIKVYLLDYLKKKNIKYKISGAVTMVECPYCHKTPMSATIPPKCNFVTCFSCCSGKKTILDLVHDLDKIEGEENIVQYIKDLLNLDIVTKKDNAQIDEVLKFYKENNFSIVPCVKNDKKPIEKDWCNKDHRDIEEWKQYLADGINIGLKTSAKSGIIVIDVDVKPVPKEILALVGNTLIQETAKGFHYIYKHVDGLIKTRIQDLKIDIETDGTTGCGQVILYPSIVEGNKRKINLVAPIEMPKALLDYLKSKITVPLKSFSEKLKEDIQTENFNLNLLGEGERNVSLLKLGGLLRKELNVQQTERVLSILNRHICTTPISTKDLNAMVKSLSKYSEFDEKELAHRVMNYLKDVEEAGRMEICSAVMGTNRGEEKIRIDKVLHYLVKEGYIQKKGSRYILLQKMIWATSLLNTDNNIGFKMPYFYDIANIEYGDLILIGAKTKVGKTNIAMNIIKQLVGQNIVPYYITLESGSRFKKISLKLGMKEEDFKYNKKWIDPIGIQLESKSIIIIDWLCPDNFAEVDKIFRHFTEQLAKTNSILIVFMQLKESDGSWFSNNLVKQFPALCMKYVYDDENDGTYGKFTDFTIRDPKWNIKKWDIPCKFDFDTKLFLRIDELEKKEVKEQIKELPKEGDTTIEIQEISN